MSDVKECDVCGDTFEVGGIGRICGRAFGRIKVPLRYRIWATIPWNRKKVGWVKQDLCRECNDHLPEAIELLKERES